MCCYEQLTCLQLHDHIRVDLFDQTRLTFFCITEDIEQAELIPEVEVSGGKCIKLLLA
jgi:hypothetical protein